ncbi:Uncharacterised protein [Mycobacterium tuberculosis]|uniref:Uncharacterized protein n=1 Tax=Mycobacterium tuberculosis TaxID=1773 RepID=A0A0U0QHU5_MYCTX|nr:Uncharacterised protein [Mycobacterium tuberculosis]
MPATDIAHANACRFISSVSRATVNSIPALSFSQTRGTAPHTVGRTSGSAAAIVRASATAVTWVPNISCRYSPVIRSAMCADGRKDVTRSPNRIPSTSSMAYPSNSRLAWVISTPLGFPVVPDV